MKKQIVLTLDLPDDQTASWLPDEIRLEGYLAQLTLSVFAESAGLLVPAASERN